MAVAAFHHFLTALPVVLNAPPVPEAPTATEEPTQYVTEPSTEFPTELPTEFTTEVYGFLLLEDEGRVVLDTLDELELPSFIILEDEEA